MNKETHYIKENAKFEPCVGKDCPYCKSNIRKRPEYKFYVMDTEVNILQMTTGLS